MKVVPQAFYRAPGIRKILVDGLSCVIAKQAHTVDRNNERYLAAHALTLVKHGQLNVQGHDGEAATVGPNHFIFLPKGLYMISDIIPKTRPFEALVFFFDEDLADQFLSRKTVELTTKAPAELLTIRCDKSLTNFVENLLLLYDSNEKDRHSVTQAKLLELLYLVSKSDNGSAFVQKLNAINNRERKGIKAFMAANYDKPLDIEDYAYLTGRSISTFHRDFKRVFDIAPKKWLIEQRLQKAHELLATQFDRTVAEIATDTGYEDTSHFIKAFQKKYGVSPKQFMIAQRSQMHV